ncbi:MAG TPA: tetratricopeptide repeat protein [Syntrophales bacterium]|jgi:tetratricopeptide (TPR) repeat protein|nr:tetratricopeptide repeat protein [Syntrophales bacterium]HRR46041.1 tetratricopeptide repeat protein [Syntrophales bacterium]
MASKTEKQEILAPDKFQVFLERTRDYILSHKRNIAVAAAVLLLVSLVGGGWAYWRHKEETTAMNVYNQAVINNSRLAVTNQDVAVTVKPFAELTAKYPATRAAMLSQYRIGNAYLNTGKIDEAMKAFQIYLREKGGDNELTVLVYNSLGYCHEAKGDFKQALNNYEKALQSKAGSPFAGDILAGMARSYEGLQNREKAREYYRQALEKIQDPTMKIIVGRKIAMLG